MPVLNAQLGRRLLVSGSKILGPVTLLHVPNSIRFWDVKVPDLRDIILGLVRFHSQRSNRHHELSDFHVMYFVPTY